MTPGQPTTPSHPRLDLAEVVERVEADRASGQLSSRIREQAEVVYQAGTNKDGGIVALYRDGRRVEGSFLNGVFVPMESSVST